MARSRLGGGPHDVVPEPLGDAFQLGALLGASLRQSDLLTATTDLGPIQTQTRSASRALKAAGESR